MLGEEGTLVFYPKNNKMTADGPKLKPGEVNLGVKDL
jgi:hypothetical protein